MAKLAGGVAVIKVGAATETELKEKKLRYGMLSPLPAAVEEGIVPGGGLALELSRLWKPLHAEGDVQTGM